MLTPTFVDPNPSPNNGFGQAIVWLSTGNVVVTSPGADVGGTDTGAVYLFNGATGELSSSLFGSTTGDFANTKITKMTNGNFVVANPSWDNGFAVDAGAVTWGSGVTGVAGTVSSANSLVGMTTNDKVGGDRDRTASVRALSNGNYVIISSHWDNGSSVDAGAVTWGNGTSGVSGSVSESNSLVGTSSYASVGVSSRWYLDSFTELSNGNYVIVTSYSNNGAVTWGSGTTGVAGALSEANSLIGTPTFVLDNDRSQTVVELTNGNYVVIGSQSVTWGNGLLGLTGEVSASNSLVGMHANDFSETTIKPLSNGNYVVVSPYWDNGETRNAGAVTWGNGVTGTNGVVSELTSLVGSSPWDLLGISGEREHGLRFDFYELTNGNYVVVSAYWDNGTAYNAGAVTWGSGTSGVKGVVSAANSLVGTSAYDQVGETFEYEDEHTGIYGGIDVLPNGNYLVKTPYWNNGPVVSAGAVTWGDGTTGVSGPVSAANSLVGKTAGDTIGSVGLPVPHDDHVDYLRFNTVNVLPNGNYVVVSPQWDNVVEPDAGAVTFGRGDSGVTGEVSGDNSVVGFQANSDIRLTQNDANNTLTASIVPEGRIVVGSQVDGFPAEGFSAAVVDGALRINVPSSRGSDVRVTRDAVRSQFVVRAYDGAVVTEEFRFATSSVTRGLVANLGGGADRFDASGVSLATTIRGGGGNDSIVGSMGNDSIDGGLGDDHLNGKAGHDRVFGGLGNDVLLGGAGDDSLSGDAGNDELWGTGGVDSLDGGDGIDSLDGGASASIIRDDVAGTVILSNTGYRTTRGDKVVTTSISRATLTGSAGADRFDTTRFTSGHITVFGGNGNDTMLGGTAIETFFGEAGDDSLQAGIGNDTLSGGSGNDRLDGGRGSNGLVESADANLALSTVSGTVRLTGLGTDTLVGLFTTVEFTGGDGNNVLDVSAFAGRATLNGGGGNDDLRGTPNTDLLIGGPGDDLLTGNADNDSLHGDAGADDLSGGLGNDLLTGGDGTDLFDGGIGTDRLVEEVAFHAEIIGLEFSNSYSWPEMLVGLEGISLRGADGVRENGGYQLMDARQSAFPVFLDGGVGDDTLFGSPFNDTVRGGLGDDVLSGGAGNDVISGGGGLDTQFESADADFTVSGTRIRSTAIGNDSVSGTGSIVLLGGDGNNRLNASAATVSVTLIGAGGNDTLTGGRQADLLIGGDRYDSAFGTDLLIGNAGADTFDNDPADTRLTGNGDNVIDEVFIPFWAEMD